MTKRTQAIYWILSQDGASRPCLSLSFLSRSAGESFGIVTSNIFGDILSDEASQISGSIGILPSVHVGAGVRLICTGIFAA